MESELPYQIAKRILPLKAAVQQSTALNIKEAAWQLIKRLRKERDNLKVGASFKKERCLRPAKYVSLALFLSIAHQRMPRVGLVLVSCK